MKEVWKPVVGFEERYEVSSLGRVRSLDRVIRQRARSGRMYLLQKKGRLLRPGKASNGYNTVALGRDNSCTIHSLVARAFIGPCPKGQEVRHKDGDRQNSVAANLEYGTRSQNIKDAVAHGTWMTPARLAHCKRLRSYRRDA